ncbi:MAG: M56 family metallopeptidase [Candidatus Shapirobacteria bacterium]
MNSKRLNLISNLYFYLIAFSGLFYTALLVFASEKIIPAFMMQIIFLLDALKFDNSLIGLVTSKLFLLNVVPGIILIGLMIRYIKTLVKSIKSAGGAKAIANKLEIVGMAKEFSRFKSSEISIFTLGFFRPKIFISSAIFKTHNQEEISAMIEHEINHKNNLHPLKIFVANFVKSVLPVIPGKNWLIENYLTLVEVSSDQFSEDKINNKLPLVSALLKFQSQNFEPGMSYFNSQSERIKILVGQKKQFLKIPMAYYSLVLMVILSGALFVKNTNIFYDCQHLLKCIELLVTPNSQPLVTAIHPQSNVFSTSDHCQ